MKVTLDIPDIVVANAVSGAGIGYWCNVRDERHSWSPTAMALTVVESITAGESRGRRVADPVHMIGREHFARALAHMASSHPESFGRIMTDRADMWDGDTLVQLACFAEVKYG